MSTDSNSGNENSNNIGNGNKKWKLTDEARAAIPVWRERWTKVATSTDEINVPLTKEAVINLYKGVTDVTPKITAVRSPIVAVIADAYAKSVWCIWQQMSKEGGGISGGTSSQLDRFTKPLDFLTSATSVADAIRLYTGKSATSKLSPRESLYAEAFTALAEVTTGLAARDSSVQAAMNVMDVIASPEFVPLLENNVTISRAYTSIIRTFSGVARDLLELEDALYVQDVNPIRGTRACIEQSVLSLLSRRSAMLDYTMEIEDIAGYVIKDVSKNSIKEVSPISKMNDVAKNINAIPDAHGIDARISSVTAIDCNTLKYELTPDVYNVTHTTSSIISNAVDELRMNPRYLPSLQGCTLEKYTWYVTVSPEDLSVQVAEDIRKATEFIPKRATSHETMNILSSTAIMNELDAAIDRAPVWHDSSTSEVYKLLVGNINFSAAGFVTNDLLYAVQFDAETKLSLLNDISKTRKVNGLAEGKSRAGELFRLSSDHLLISNEVYAGIYLTVLSETQDYITERHLDDTGFAALQSLDRDIQLDSLTSRTINESIKNIAWGWTVDASSSMADLSRSSSIIRRDRFDTEDRLLESLDCMVSSLTDMKHTYRNPHPLSLPFSSDNVNVLLIPNVMNESLSVDAGLFLSDYDGDVYSQLTSRFLSLSSHGVLVQFADYIVSRIVPYYSFAPLHDTVASQTSLVQGLTASCLSRSEKIEDASEVRGDGIDPMHFAYNTTHSTVTDIVFGEIYDKLYDIVYNVNHSQPTATNNAVDNAIPKVTYTVRDHINAMEIRDELAKGKHTFLVEILSKADDPNHEIHAMSSIGFLPNNLNGSSASEVLDPIVKVVTTYPSRLFDETVRTNPFGNSYGTGVLITDTCNFVSSVYGGLDDIGYGDFTSRLSSDLYDMPVRGIPHHTDLTVMQSVYAVLDKVIDTTMNDTVLDFVEQSYKEESIGSYVGDGTLITDTYAYAGLNSINTEEEWKDAELLYMDMYQMPATAITSDTESVIENILDWVRMRKNAPPGLDGASIVEAAAREVSFLKGSHATEYLHENFNHIVECQTIDYVREYVIQDPVKDGERRFIIRRRFDPKRDVSPYIPYGTTAFNTLYAMINADVIPQMEKTLPVEISDSIELGSILDGFVKDVSMIGDCYWKHATTFCPGFDENKIVRDGTGYVEMTDVQGRSWTILTEVEECLMSTIHKDYSPDYVPNMSNSDIIDTVIAACDTFTRMIFGRTISDVAIKAVQYWRNSYNGGNEYAASVCFISFVRDECNFTHPSHERYAYYEQAALHGGPRFMHEKYTILCNRPLSRSFNDRMEPHNETGPSIEYRCGTKDWHINGVRLNEKIVLNPQDLTIDEIRSESNQEVRSIMIDRFGMERFIKESGAVMIDRRWNERDCQYEELYIVNDGTVDEQGEFDADGKLPEVHSKVMKVVDPSTGRIYFMGVGVDVKTCQEGQDFMSHGLDFLSIHRS